MHKSILFYRSDPVKPEQGPRPGEWKKIDLKEEDEAEVSIDLKHLYGEKVAKMAETIGFSGIVPRAQMEQFERLWNTPPNKVVGPDGNLKETRGLGYQSGQENQPYYSIKEISQGRGRGRGWGRGPGKNFTPIGHSSRQNSNEAWCLIASDAGSSDIENDQESSDDGAFGNDGQFDEDGPEEEDPVTLEGLDHKLWHCHQELTNLHTWNSKVIDLLYDIGFVAQNPLRNNEKSFDRSINFHDWVDRRKWDLIDRDQREREKEERTAR